MKNLYTRLIVLKIVLVLGLIGNVGIGFTQINKQKVEAEFSKAMKLRDEGKLEQSIKAFHGILSNNPALQRARLELAVAYFFSLKYIKALKYAREVLADKNTPSTVRKTIREFIAKIRAARPRHKYKPFLSFGIAHDSNVTAGPDQNVLAGFPLTAVQQKTADSAFLIQFGVSHRFSSDIELNFGKKSAALLWLSKASYYHTNYFEENDSDLGVLSFSTGPALASDNNWRAALNFRYDNIDLGSNQYAQFQAINPSVTKTSKDGRVEITLDVYVQSRDYKRTTDVGRDSDYLAYGLSYGRVLQNDKFSYQVGFRVFDESATQNHNSNDGVEYFAGLSWRYSKFDNSYFRVSHKQLDYGAVEPGFSVIRDESVSRYVLGYEHRFRKGWLKGWTANTHVTYTNTDSNEPVFGYDRTQFGVTFGKSFN